jgi:hypothetical protein
LEGILAGRYTTFSGLALVGLLPLLGGVIGRTTYGSAGRSLALVGTTCGLLLASSYSHGLVEFAQNHAFRKTLKECSLESIPTDRCLLGLYHPEAEKPRADVQWLKQQELAGYSK